MRITLDPGDPAPIYEQIRAGIAEQILTGVLTAGTPLPSIRVLARDLRVSVITTTRAYNELVADGLVDSVRGKGIYVRGQDPTELRRRAEERITTQLEEVVRTARVGGLSDADVHHRVDQALRAAPLDGPAPPRTSRLFEAIPRKETP